MGEEIAFQNGLILLLSSACNLDLGSGHAAYRHSSLIDLYRHSKFHWDQKKTFFENHNCRYCQVQSHVTQKLGQKKKIRPDKLWLLCPKNLWSFASWHINGGGDSLWKWPNFRLSGARDLELGSGHTAYHHASLVNLYLHTTFHWNRRNFLWTDGRLDIWDPLY